MKKGLIIISSLIIYLSSGAQTLDQVEITGNKFTYFLFSDTVKRVDVGTDQIHADYDVNSVKITPLSSGFPETSVFILMTNGEYKYYIVNYAETPSKLVYDYRQELRPVVKELKKADELHGAFEFRAYFDLTSEMKTKVIDNAKAVLETEPNIYDVAINRSKVLTKLDNVAYDGTFIYLKFNIENSANIDYHHDFCKFFIVNKKSVKKKGLQEIEQVAIMSFNSTDTVKRGEIMPLIFAFEKFTITDNKRLRAEFWEAKGDRKTEVYIDNQEILNALNL